jgi:hypothetical protein
VSLAHITDHAAQQLARIDSSLLTGAKRVAVYAALSKQVQAIEDALWDLLTLRAIDLASGAQLDNLGRIVGESRLGHDDPTYLLFIKARIRRNRSSGNPEELYGIFKPLLDPAAKLNLVGYWPAAFEFRIGNVDLTATVAVFRGILSSCTAGGVGSTLTYQTVDDAHAFTLGDANGGSVPGLGLGDTGDPSAGGALAGAV